MSRQFATVREFREFASERIGEEHMPFGCEWLFALTAGWDKVEFEEIYSDYVWSTQLNLVQGDDATRLKGDPLEELARYFLERGGVVTRIRELSSPARWQVDGQGSLNITATKETWGKTAQDLGFQLYLETKNHSDPARGDEFSEHFRRMMNHDCRTGVFVSTSGFRVGRGLGIAESIRENYLTGIVHLLLSFPLLRQVRVDRMPPLAILRDVLCFAANNSYADDKLVQQLYSAEYCQTCVEQEFEELFPNDA